MKSFLPKDIHQGIALSLYAVVIALVRLSVLPLVLLVCAHTGEYVFISRKLASKLNLPQLGTAVSTILYGFTWWKPLKNKE